MKITSNGSGAGVVPLKVWTCALVSPVACAMARAVRDRLGETLKSRQLRTTRLFVYGPFAMSVFLGQQLTSMGQVQLFEYQDPGYVPSCALRT